MFGGWAEVVMACRLVNMIDLIAVHEKNSCLTKKDHIITDI